MTAEEEVCEYRERLSVAAYEHRLCESFSCAVLIESHCQNHCPQVYPCNTLCLLEGMDLD